MARLSSFGDLQLQNNLCVAISLCEFKNPFENQVDFVRALIDSKRDLIFTVRFRLASFCCCLIMILFWCFFSSLVVRGKWLRRWSARWKNLIWPVRPVKRCFYSRPRSWQKRHTKWPPAQHSCIRWAQEPAWLCLLWKTWPCKSTRSLRFCLLFPVRFFFWKYFPSQIKFGFRFFGEACAARSRSCQSCESVGGVWRGTVRRCIGRVCGRTLRHSPDESTACVHPDRRRYQRSCFSHAALAHEVASRSTARSAAFPCRTCISLPTCTSSDAV